MRLGEPGSVNPQASARVCGIVSAVKKKIDKRGNLMAFVSLEDFTGKGECIVFSDAFQKYSSVLTPDAMVMVIGKGEVSGDTVKILVNEVIPMEQVREKFTRSVNLLVDLDKVSENTVIELRKVLEEHRGKCLCYLTVTGGGLQRNSLYLTRRHVVNPDGAFLAAIRQLLGPTAVRLQG